MWDERYEREEYYFGTGPNTFLKEQCGLLKKGKLLCLADGEGRNSVFLARRGFEVTAVDSSRKGLEKAQRLAKQHGVSVEYVHADLQQYDLGQQKWSGIISIFCHLPPTVRIDLHKRLGASLVDGGLLLLEAYTPEQLKRGTGGPPKVEMMMTASLLKRELEGLSFFHLEEIEREVIEGPGHTGRGAVVQAICVKKAASYFDCSFSRLSG